MTRRLLVGLLLALLAAACAAKRPPVDAAPSPAAALVTRAQALTAQGSPRDARKLYLKVLQDYPEDPAAFDARYGLAQLHLDPKSPLRNYSLALVNLDRLVARYGKTGGSWLPEVETWRAALRRLSYCETQTKKLNEDVTRLRAVESSMDQLRELDLELEPKP
jgi:hypothetical protein